jgi:hypothetical protein
LAALLGVLAADFKAIGEDDQLLQQRKFVLEDAATKQIIDVDQPWEGLLFPGQRIAMNMIIEVTSALNMCPKCDAFNPGSGSHGFTW